MKSKYGKRKWLYVWTFALLPIIFLLFEAQANTVFTVPVDTDAWVSESSPGTNYGSNSYLTVKDSSKRAEGYLRFSNSSLSALAGKKIVSASLYAYQYQGAYSPGDEVYLHQVVSDWQESSVTWNTKPPYEAQSIGSASFTGGTNTWREWDGLEGPVNSWLTGPNYGVVLENSQDGKLDELYSRFYSSEYSSQGLRPYLEVVVGSSTPEKMASTVPEPFTSSLLLIGIGALGAGKLRKHN